ncbi:M48 family metalloprotease [Treponema sp. R80B11-R83G3]
MNKKIMLALVVMIFFITATCKHIDSLAQAAANADIIDHGTADMISLSARAFGSAAENATPEQEYFIGRAVAANILSNYKIWDKSPALTAYLNYICGAIVINSPEPNIFNGYHVAILDSNDINAFTTSGGHIFLTRGLIKIAQTEDALAAVVAHEVAHNQLKHSLKAIKTSRVTQAFLITATAGVGALTGMDANEFAEALDESVGEIMQTMVNSGYSREQEYEADIAAMCFMAAAGYQPSGLIDMLNELKAVHRIGLGLSKTHPAPGQRIYYAEKALGRFTVADTSPSRQERFTEALKIN